MTRTPLSWSKGQKVKGQVTCEAGAYCGGFPHSLLGLLLLLLLFSRLLLRSYILLLQLSEGNVQTCTRLNVYAKVTATISFRPTSFDSHSTPAIRQPFGRIAVESLSCLGLYGPGPIYSHKNRKLKVSYIKIVLDYSGTHGCKIERAWRDYFNRTRRKQQLVGACFEHA